MAATPRAFGGGDATVLTSTCCRQPRGADVTCFQYKMLLFHGTLYEAEAVSVGLLFAKAIRRIHMRESIRVLFPALRRGTAMFHGLPDSDCRCAGAGR